MAGIGSASVNISGCILPTSQDCVRKSRSQGGENEQHKIFLSKSHADESMTRALFSRSANKCFSYLMHIFYKLAIENCCCNERYQNINLDQQCMKSEVIAAFLVNSWRKEILEVRFTGTSGKYIQIGTLHYLRFFNQLSNGCVLDNRRVLLFCNLCLKSLLWTIWRHTTRTIFHVQMTNNLSSTVRNEFIYSIKTLYYMFNTLSGNVWTLSLEYLSTSEECSRDFLLVRFFSVSKTPCGSRNPFLATSVVQFPV